MAETLTISTTAGTVNLLSAASQTATGYFADYLPSIGDGRESDSTTTDTFPLYVNGTSRADLASKLNTLQQYFQQAQTWQENKSGPRVFANWQPEGYAAARRSEIVAGSYYLAPGFKTQFSEAKGHHALVSVEMTRRNWWEGAEATATITSLNSDYKVYNNGDFSGTSPTKKVNYWDIDATALAGDLPAPVKLYMVASNLSGSPTPDISITMARSPARMEYAAIESTWWESGSGWGGTADTNRTNDSLATKTPLSEGTDLLSVASTTYQAQFSTDIGMYKLYGLWKCGTAGSYKITETFKVQTNQYYLTFDGTNFVYVDSKPFIGPSSFSSARATSGVGITVSANPSNGLLFTADWFHLVRVDAYKKYSGITLGATNVIEDDQIDGDAIYKVESNYRTWDVSTLGKNTGFFLKPGSWHRFYMHCKVNITAPKTVYIIPTVTYRPRYLCL